ncbi:MAG: P-II family nitrogen regulator [Treponema sp.]|jgi:nitrogen regulatory protein PII|nr:P-II family nitrogen regulator [Treponema sp.]
MSDHIAKPSEKEPVKPAALPVVKLLFFIIDWGKTKVITSVFEDEKVRFHFISKGKGTASSEILDLLGIGASEKAVILCLEQDIMVPVLLREVRKKLGFHSPGAGIAFTVPLSGINNPILQVFKESILKNEKIAVEKEGGTMSGEIKNDLIIAIINQGYCDEFMSTAREAGATGGTVLNARGIAHQGPVKFFGVSVQDEKEIIIILTKREKKTAIMQAVSQAYGIASKAEGIVFSLPVDNVMGLSFE